MEWMMFEVIDTEYPVTYIIKIDEEDSWILKHDIHISRSKKTHRPKGLKVIIDEEYITVHRLIKKCKNVKTQIHHKNMNHLDVRKENLEEVGSKRHSEIHKYLQPPNNIIFAEKVPVAQPGSAGD